MREAKLGHLNLIAVTAIQLFSQIGFVFQNDTGGGSVSDAHSVEEVHLEAPFGKFARCGVWWRVFVGDLASFCAAVAMVSGSLTLNIGGRLIPNGNRGP